MASVARGAVNDFVKQPVHGHPLVDATAALFVGAAFLIAALRVFRGLRFRELMFDKPRKVVFALIVRRRFVARCDAECFLFEAGVVLVSLLSASTLSGIVKMLLVAVVS